jgi:hypothetical protein
MNILLNAAIVCWILVLQYAGTLVKTSYTLLLSAGAIAIAAIYGRAFQRRLSETAPVITLNRRSASPMLICVLTTIAVKWVIDVANHWAIDPISALVIGSNDAFIYLLAVVLLKISTKQSWVVIPASLGIGIAFYAVTNLVAFNLGVIPDRGIQQAYAAIATGRERFLAPFGPGLNNFANIVSVGVACCIFSIRPLMLGRHFGLAIATAAAAAVSIYTVVLVEMRAGLLSFLMALVWNSVKSLRIKGTLALLTALLIPLLPVVSYSGWLAKVLTLELPDSVVSRIQRSSEDIGSLGGRDEMWAYGIDQIRSGAVGVLGQGLNRDAGAVVSEASKDNFGGVAFSYHNGAIELIVVYGLGFGVIATCVMLACFVSGGVRATADSQESHSTALGSCSDGCFGILICIAMLNVFEAFAATAVFWAAIATILAVKLRNRICGGFVRKCEALPCG